jgi:hypothetical protein
MHAHLRVKIRIAANSVIARSSCDEAIQSLLAALDCFAPLAMTELTR